MVFSMGNKYPMLSVFVLQYVGNACGPKERLVAHNMEVKRSFVSDKALINLTEEWDRFVEETKISYEPFLWGCDPTLLPQDVVDEFNDKKNFEDGE